MKICFATEVTYPNYVERIKQSSLKWFLEKELNKKEIHYYISTNLPENFEEYKYTENIKIFDIEDLRSDRPISKEYELFPEDPTGIYPSRYPWNTRRFIVERAAKDGFDYIVYLEADNVLHINYDGDDIKKVLIGNYHPNTLQTNSAIFRYKNKAPHDVFEHHEKYIEHFNLKFEGHQYDTLDGACQVFIGETNKDILRLIDNWHKFTEFGYKKDFGYGYGNNAHGVLSFVIPVSNFELKESGFPFYPHHNFEDRY